MIKLNGHDACSTARQDSGLFQFLLCLLNGPYLDSLVCPSCSQVLPIAAEAQGTDLTIMGFLELEGGGGGGGGGEDETDKDQQHVHVCFVYKL